MSLFMWVGNEDVTTVHTSSVGVRLHMRATDTCMKHYEVHNGFQGVGMGGGGTDMFEHVKS